MTLKYVYNTVLIRSNMETIAIQTHQLHLELIRRLIAYPNKTLIRPYRPICRQAKWVEENKRRGMDPIPILIANHSQKRP